MKRLLLCLAVALLTSGCFPLWAGYLIRDLVFSPAMAYAVHRDRLAHGGDLTPLNAGRSEGPDRPTIPEPGGQESF